MLQREHDTLKELASKVYAKHSHLVELSQLLKTKAAPNEQEFFRPQTKENIKTPASSVVRSVLGGESYKGVQRKNRQQQSYLELELPAGKGGGSPVASLIYKPALLTGRGQSISGLQ